MTGLNDAIARAARRQLFQQAIRHSGAGLAAALATGCLLLLADRFLRLELPLVLYLTIAVAGLILGLIATVLRRPDAHTLALRIDRVFRLKDRLPTAVALTAAKRTARQDPAFVQWVQRDADRLAERIDVRPVTPVHLSGTWGGAIALAAALAAGFLFLPARAEPRPDPELGGGAALSEDEREEVRGTLEQAVSDLREDADLAAAAGEDLEALEDLAEQLNTGSVDGRSSPGSVRDETAAKLTEVADRLAEQAERDAAASEELTRRFHEISRPDAPLTAQEFNDALRRGDFGDAAELLDELLRDSEGMTQEERQVASEHLREMGDRLGGAVTRDEKELSERLAQLEQALRDQGLSDERAAELSDGGRERDSEELRRALEQENIDPEIADQLARDLERLQERRRQQEQVQQDARELNEALGSAADAVERGERPQEPARDETRARDVPPQAPTSDPAADDRGASEREEAPSSERASEEQEPKPAGADRHTESEQSRQQPGESREDRGQRQESGEAQPREAQSESSEAQQAESREAQQAESREAQQSESREGKSQEARDREDEPSPTKEAAEDPGSDAQAPGQTPSTDPQASPDARPEAGSPAREATPPDQRSPDAPGQQQLAREGEGDGDQSEQRMLRDDPGAAETGESPPPGLSREGAQDGQSPATAEGDDDASPPDARRLLHELERRRDRAARQRDAAERFQQMARELSEDMGDEERQRWAEQWQRELGQGDGSGIGRQPSPPVAEGDASLPPDAVEEVDLTGQQLADDTIIEWLRDERPGAAEGARSGSASSRVRRAQEAAERAVNESSVPPRYHEFIRRYFERLDETVGAASSESRSAESGSGDDER